VAFIILMFFPIQYRLPADCRVQPVIRRTVAAPFENILDKAYVKPGDDVKTGDILAELDGREVRVSLAEAIASRNAAYKKRDSAMVNSNAADQQMAQLEAKRADEEVKRLTYRNENLIIRSPIDGLVLTGNLERSEGVPVTTGQKLYEIAPLDEMILEIAIPEGEIRHATPGMEVQMRLESETGRVWETEILNIHPVSEVKDGENVFVAEARVLNEDEVLRPGMKGSIRVLAEKKSIGWILFHRLWEYIRLKLW
ncbi:MAG: efflux RND transporter periplasmic adaptor subunit, partial [Verrucomicrobiota bacterium]